MHAPTAPAASTTRAPWITADCRLVLLRSVRHGDEPLLEAFFGGLSPASRLRRFHSGVVAVPPGWLHRMTHPDPRHEWALIALAFDDDRPVCVGEARYALGDGPPGEREFALTVADAWQGAGLGGELLRRLAEHAGRHGVRRLVGDVLRDNLAMAALARRHGYTVRTSPYDARLLRATRDLEAGAPDGGVRQMGSAAALAAPLAAPMDAPSVH